MKLVKKLGLAAVACLAVLGMACKNEKTQSNVITLAEAEEMFAGSLNAADTTQVLALGRQFMDSIQAGNIEFSLAMLAIRNADGELVPLNEQQKEQLRMRFDQFPVKSYELDHYDFSIPSLNDLKYKYSFTDDPTEGTLGLMFNPVKAGDTWVLMLKQHNQPAKDAKNSLSEDTPVVLPGAEGRNEVPAEE